jgi:hypothetical protein
MNATTASVPFGQYQPQTDRMGLLHRGISLVLFSVLLVFLSVYVSEISPKLGVLLVTFCVFMGGKRLLQPSIWPLVAIIAYGALVGELFPSDSRPEIGTVLKYPLFLLSCVLLAALVLGGQSLRRQYAFFICMLIVSLIGAIGDSMGHDMTALLPFPMPDDDFSTILLAHQGGDVVRIRGFFTEAGVLAAISAGVATMLGMGAMVVLRIRGRSPLALIGLASACCLGGALVIIAVTKSGFLMLTAGIVGFSLVLFACRNPRCRGVAFAVLASLIIGGTAFMILGPPTLTTYLRGEFVAAMNPGDHGATMGHGGTVTRYQCWRITLSSIIEYPMGVGPYGLGNVISREGNAGQTHELRYFFARDSFGMKNALANLMVRTGMVGVGLLLFWMWVAFLVPIRQYLADASIDHALIAGVYGASALVCLLFLFSCELYPSLAFLIILKFHADAVAQACHFDVKPGFESVELIG